MLPSFHRENLDLKSSSSILTCVSHKWWIKKPARKALLVMNALLLLKDYYSQRDWSNPELKLQLQGELVADLVAESTDRWL